MTQRDVVRAGDIADFRVLVKVALAFTTTGYMVLDFSKNDITGATGGFVLSLAEKKVCEFIDIKT